MNTTDKMTVGQYRDYIEDKRRLNEYLEAAATDQAKETPTRSNRFRWQRRAMARRK